MKPSLDRATNFVMIIFCTVAVVLLFRRELRDSRRDLQSKNVTRDLESNGFQRLNHWQILAGRGRRIGRADAPLQVVEFADFQCPACAALHRGWRDAVQEMGDSISLVFVHYPIESHEFALPAAHAAECASEQGKFEEMHDLLFDQQDSISRWTMQRFAQLSGVPSLTQFENCTRRQVHAERIAEGRALGDSLQVAGTPTLFINGWRIEGAPPPAQFVNYLRDILAGKKPSR